MTVPATLGYRAAAEWEPHAATWLSWPHREATWPDAFDEVPGVWAGLVETLCKFEPVHILAGGQSVMAQARPMVGDLPASRCTTFPPTTPGPAITGRCFWSGPPSRSCVVDWGYNAWGGKYPPFDLDNAVPKTRSPIARLPRFEPGIILEGGAVDFNGQGSVLTSEECLLNTNRNPQLDRTQIERYLADYCAARNAIWLGGGIVGDDTDGHIDELARFAAPRVVVAAKSSTRPMKTIGASG